MYRGEIWWANFPQPMGSEPGYRRPILIVSDDGFNRSEIKTIIAVVITSNLELAKAPSNVYLGKHQTGLPKDSVVNVLQVVTLDKGFLTDRVGTLERELMEMIDEGLRMVLYL
jgi:mRNA interferase MazF